jgi:hypothetical protein
MSRSTYIYILLDPDNHDELVAAFTVKHEMISWASFQGRRGIDGYTVVRVRDGGDRASHINEGE